MGKGEAFTLNRSSLGGRSAYSYIHTIYIQIVNACHLKYGKGGKQPKRPESLPWPGRGKWSRR